MSQYLEKFRWIKMLIFSNLTKSQNILIKIYLYFIKRVLLHFTRMLYLKVLSKLAVI